ncbi:polyamine-modulated factor 1 [Synchiropus splendidus]|uniref:polyamine-modulated factor 1 n=1 Tax=Synchiropus splendidus TaxID=270530 RepID=UPI00237D43CE|nr:polyamine-modulated factor 1 [Synchiropus splendidus]
MEENAAPPRKEAENVGDSSTPQDGPPKESVAAPSAAGCGRFKLFEKILETSIEKFMCIAREQFASKFGVLYKNNPKLVASIHKEFIEELRKAIQEDINRMIEEGRFESKLNALDKLESEARNNPEPAWRPTGVPEKDVGSFLVPYYKKQEAYLQKELKKIQAENATIAEKVRAGRENITQTEQKIAAAVEDWKVTVSEFGRLSSTLHPGNVF